MADEMDDVDALLEAPYKNKEDETTNGNGRSPSRKSGDHRSRTPDRHDRGHRNKEGRRKDRSRSKDKERKNRRSKSKERSSKSRRSGSKDRSEKKRSRSRERSHKRSRSKSKERKRSKSKERRRSRSREGRRSRSRDRGGFRGIGRRSPRRGPSPAPAAPRFGGRFGRSRSRSPTDLPLTPEERDSRTIFVMQLSQRVRARDIEEFFSAVGKIRDTKLIMCNKTRRFKGIAYVEFKEIESVPLALGLNGQKLLGVPVIVQPSQAEKNRVTTYGAEGAANALGASASLNAAGSNKGPMRLYVGSLHFNITEDMLRGIFEPFGKISMIQLIMDQETGRSKGYGFITYSEAEDAKKALEQMNGFELAGRAMKVGHVTDRTDGQLGGMGGQGDLDSEHLDKTGIDLGATGRLALMAKLAQGTGMQLPQAANQALNSAVMQAAGNPASVRDANAAAHNAQRQQAQQNLSGQAPPIATQCFMLSNMFDPTTETAPGWDLEVRDDVIEEGNKHGGFLHIVVDKASPQGNVYVKCPNIATAVAAVNALHGRWFAGKVITAAYVPLVNYHNLFPDSVYSTQLLTTRR